MKRNLHRHEKEESLIGHRYEQWQSAKLRDLERFRRENEQIIAQFKPGIVQKIEQTIKNSYRQGMQRVMGFFGRLGDQVGLILPGRAESTPGAYRNGNRPLDINFFQTQDERLKSLITETVEPVEDATRAITRYMDDQYRQIIKKAQVALTSGTYTMDKALDTAISDFLNRGITNITYKDGSIRSIDSYAEMALRTAAHRAFLAGQGETRKELGIATVIVSSHDSICGLCAPWQNVVLIDDVWSGGTADGIYPLVSQAIKAGLLHPNCQHNLDTFIPGITKVPEPEEQRAKILRGKLQQKQRAIERDIRKLKMALAGLSDPEAIQTARRKLDRAEIRMKALMELDPAMRRQPERERIRLKGKR
ncbi:Phage minor capsid protein 2 [anaerobic digester metagenome]